MLAVAGTKPHPRNGDFAWRDVPKDRDLRRLTWNEVSAFDRDGFLLVKGAFTPEEIAEVTAAIDPIEAAHEQHVAAQEGGNFYLSSAGAVTFTTNLVEQAPLLRTFAGHPAIAAICHDLIGGRVRLYWDQSVYKKTGKPREFPWHQDNGYTFIEPQQYLTFWVPLVDVTVENGAPWIARGLHKAGTFEHWDTPIGLKCLESDPAEAVPVEAQIGDIVLFSSLAPHRTGPNLVPGSVRKAYILQYAPDGARTFHDYAEDGTLQDDPDRQFVIEG